MNYLAHLALSHFDSDVMLGNFMGDSVKGSDYNRYSPRVRAGLLLHRKIDAFTDQNEIVWESIKLFRETYGHYAGIICDMVYDHFLSAEWKYIYPQIELSKFTGLAHKIFLINYFRLPGKLRKILPFIIKSHRFERYATLDGLAETLGIMARHTSLPDRTDVAIDILRENYSLLKSHFCAFYPLVSNLADEELISIPSPYSSAALTMRSFAQ